MIKDLDNDKNSYLRHCFVALARELNRSDKYIDLNFIEAYGFGSKYGYPWGTAHTYKEFYDLLRSNRLYI